jgi:hypothetical protein
MKLKLYGIAAAVALAFALPAAQAQTTGGAAPSTPSAGKSSSADRKMKNAEEDRIEADYKADKAKCDSMNGNAKDVCQKEAKGKEKVAKAELDAKKDPSARNQRKVEEAKADAKYDVAKEKCDGMKGNEKSACEKDAKAEHERAQADIKRNSAAGASSGASTRKSSATSTHTTGTTK